jgi:DNA-binding beta-propeller fold protein YncE
MHYRIILVGFLILAAFLVVGFASAALAASGASGYHVLKTITIGSAKGWDYLTMDRAARRLYIGASNHLDVVDVDSGAAVGKVTDLPEVHGIALALDLGRGFTTNGGTNESTIVDLKTLKKIEAVKTGKSPDSMVYDGFTKRVFIMNVEDNTATAIDGAAGTVAGSVPLGGRPEFAVADGKGNVFVNITDKSEMLEFDGKKLAVLHRWSLAPCDTPSGLSMDQENRRLFSVCQNKMMVVMNADTGKVVATPEIGEGVDTSVFDPDTQHSCQPSLVSGSV